MMGTIVSDRCQLYVLNAMLNRGKLTPKAITVHVPYKTTTVKAALYILLKTGKIKCEGPDGGRLYWRE